MNARNGIGSESGKVDAGLMMRHLTEFARWTKLSGSADEAQSLRYVEKQMASYGYATRVLHHPAYISLPGAARAVADGVEMKAITHSMSLSSPAGGVTGPVIYAGKGAGEDFTTRDVRGAIVLVEGMATPAAALRASRAGAVGELHISPHEHLHEMCISPVWGSPDTRTMVNMPTVVALTIGIADGKTLREKLAAGEQPRVVLHADVDTGWRPTPILVADMDAPDADDRTPFVLFSGHHDTWYQGVMDNGAANATMMEVARLCAQRRGDWRRSLRFCFWSGHSHGRYSGSQWYADACWHELERRCAVHVNADSTGGVGATDFAEAAAAIELAGVADDVLGAETGQGFSGKRLARNSDQSFWGIGIPSIFGILSAQPENRLGLRNSLGWWWHTPQDVLDKIDPAFLERDTKVYRRLLVRLLTDPVLPIDIAAQVEDLHGTLAGIGLTDGADVSRDELLAEIVRLKTMCGSLAAWMKETGHGKAAEADRLLMRLSRALVPIDYTSGNRFAHDPALPQAKWPALDPVRRFAAEPQGSDKWYFLQIEARRALNVVRSAVRQACRELEQFAGKKT